MKYDLLFSEYLKTPKVIMHIMKHQVLISYISIIILMASMFLVSNQNITALPEEVNDWSEDVRLTNDQEDSYRPDIAVDSNNNIYVIWVDERLNDPSRQLEVYSKIFNGNTWGPDTRIDYNDDAYSTDPTITVDSKDNIHVAFVDDRRLDGKDEIYYSKYDGFSWTTPLRVTYNSGYNRGWSPQLGPKIITDLKDNIYIFWSGYKNNNGLNGRDIFYIKYDGNSWSSIQDVTNDPREDYEHTNFDVITDSNDDLHIAYTTIYPAESGGYHYITDYRKFLNNVWSDEKQISNSEVGFTGFPSIAIDSQHNVHIIWSDDRDHPDTYLSDLYYSKLDTNGNIVIDNMKLTDEPESASFPNMVFDSFDNIHIVRQNKDSNASDYKIWYIKMTNNGKILTDIYLSDANYQSADQPINPHIDSDSFNQLHIIFGDNRNGNLEIYYKQSYTHDLWLKSEDITITDSEPIENDEITINAKIHNFGLEPADIKINFYFDSATEDKLIGSNTMQVPKDGIATVSVKWQAVAGEHNIFVLADADNAIMETDEYNNIVNKSIFVQPLPKPSIAITYPYDNDIISGTITVTTNALNTNLIEFYLDEQLKADSTALPFNWEWETKAVVNGDHILKVIAYDDRENTAVALINITVDNPTDITPPEILSGPLVEVGETTAVITWTTDEASTGEVEYGIISVNDGMEMDLDYTTTHNITLTDLDYGTKYNYRIKSIDQFDNTLISDIYSFITSGEDDVAPEVEILYPQSDEIVSGTINITINAIDNVDIVKIEIYIDNVLITTLDSKPYIYYWDTTEVEDGEHTISVKAYDGKLYSEFEIIEINVDNNESNNIINEPMTNFSMIILVTLIIILIIMGLVFLLRRKPVEIVTIDKNHDDALEAEIIEEDDK